jgi:pyruvate formate lyase activating enzyme
MPDLGTIGPHAHEARWWERARDGRAHCFLCPRHCRLRDGQAGFCAVRENRGGNLVSTVYGAPSAVHADPIEKKPLFHFLPGTSVLSLGTVGCDLACSFCQNWPLSRGRPGDRAALALSPGEVAALAVRQGCPSVAFTFNEPVIWAEYALDIAAAARERGIATVMVTNGYVTPEAFRDVFGGIDAANVDLKALSDDFYRRETLARLAPVLETLRRLRGETDAWLEVTNLLVPGLNDNEDDVRRLADWVVGNLGPDVPLHLNAFHPEHRLSHLPPTAPGTLRRARHVALGAGLRYVYTGNAPAEEVVTSCPDCGAVLVRRSGHALLEDRLEDGRCPGCRRTIPGRWQRTIKEDR